jgi:hypothetical protein
MDGISFVYEDCLSRLTSQERGDLIRLIEIMSQSLPGEEGFLPQTPRP